MTDFVESLAVPVEVEVVPGSVESSLDLVDALVDELTQGAGSVPEMDPADAEAMRWLRKFRPEPNRVRKQLGEARKQAVADYMRPINGFVDRCKAAESRLQALDVEIKAKLDQADEVWLSRRKAALQEAYEEFAPLLVPVVPLEKVLPEKWHLKGTTDAKAVELMQAKVSRIASDWELVKEAAPEGYLGQAERDFFESLNAGLAVAHAKEAKARDERISAMKAEMAEPEPLECPPEPSSEPQGVSPETVEEVAEEAASEPQTASGAAKADPPRDWTVTVWGATKAQMKELGAALQALGLRGHVESVKRA